MKKEVGEWVIVAKLKPIITAMQEEGVVYVDRTEMWFGIRWRGLNYDWVMILKVGKKGGMTGAEYVLDQSQPILANQLLGAIEFRPKSTPPFTALWYRLVDDGSFVPWIKTQLQQNLVPVELAKQFLPEYLLMANDVFAKAREVDLRSEITLLQRPANINRPFWEVSGGAPSLGKRS